MTDPTQINIFTTKQFKEDAFKRFGAGKFELTATQGSAITLPNGKTVNKAFRGIAVSSQEKLRLAIDSGAYSGETSQQIAKQLVGKLNFADLGPLSVKQLAASGGELTKIANRQIQTIVRTSVNQVQNQASQAVYAANSKIAPKYEYVATLDSRTTPICQRLDGQQFKYNKGPTPPQHFNCRSTTVPIIDDEDLRKKFPDTRPSATGRVPQGMNYATWLKDNPSIQTDALGNKKRFFNYLIDKKRKSPREALRLIIKDDGTELPLKELIKKYPNAT